MDILDPGFSCLRDLVFSFDKIQPAVLDEPRAGLFEVKGRIRPQALFTCVQYPFIVARSGVISRFTAAGDLFDFSALQIPLNLDLLQHRFVDDSSMFDR